MTEPSDDEVVAQPERNYASDRHLLLREVQLLGKEVSRLRGDTKYLNDITVPREEHARRRRVNSILAGLSLLLFAISMIGVYIIGSRLQATNDNFSQTAYQACLSRNASAVANAAATKEINALLTTLRESEERIATAGNTDALTQAFAERTRAYDRYLAFVAQQGRATAGPKPPECISYLR